MLKLSFLAALYLLTTSCIESKKDDKPDVTPSNTNGDAALLIGSWGSGCVADDFSSFQVDYSFSSNYMEFKQENSVDNNFDCTVPAFQERYRFNYLANNGLLEVKEVIQLFLTAYLEDDVIMYNNNSYCGFNDWVANEEKEVDMDLCGIAMGMEFSNAEFEVTSTTLKLREYGTAPSVNDPVFTKK